MIADDEYGQLYTDNMANLSKVTGSERIRDERSVHFVQSDFTQNLAFNEQFFSNSQYSVDNVVCENGFLNANSAPDFETELELSYSPEWQDCAGIDDALECNYSNNFTNVPPQMYDPKATIVENTQFVDPSTNVDYSKLNVDEDSLEKYQQLEDDSIIISQMKDEDNKRLMDDFINDILNGSVSKRIKNTSNLNLTFEAISDDAFTKRVPTTPELVETVGELEAEKQPLELVSSHKCIIKRFRSFI